MNKENYTDFRFVIKNVKEINDNQQDDYGFMLGIQGQYYLFFLPMEHNLNTSIEITIEMKWNHDNTRQITLVLIPTKSDLYLSYKKSTIYYMELRLSTTGFPSRTDLQSFQEIKNIIKASFHNQLETINDLKLQYFPTYVSYAFTLDKWTKLPKCYRLLKTLYWFRKEIYKNMEAHGIEVKKVYSM
ncbi:hypothetical protein RF11_12773 [Thelohanellus kitauei]|uniref:Uncharacterized protein n=1 Tax=Thelohanellus kitauei TaxID=669202 RepID=A0A0C2MAK2_THEKT|nr:hypothetical protein RF11_12773 [Thelohanellus kitauei]